MSLTIQNKINLKCNQLGFTFVEILITIVIFSLGILGILKISDSVSYYQSRSFENTRATLFVTNKIEEIKHLSVNETSGGIHGFDYLIKKYPSDVGMNKLDEKSYSLDEIINEGNGSAIITRTLIFKTYPSESDIKFSDPALINVLEIIVKAEWLDKRGLTQNVELGSLIHRRQFIE